MNINIERPIKIFAKDGEYGRMYSTSISNKKQDGTYQTSYVSLRFRKEIKLENETMITNCSGWLIPTTDKNKVAVFINDFNLYESEPIEEDNSFDGLTSKGEVILADEDLPF